MDHEFIIVGAGSSGASLAARLADAGRDVLLLEAGPDYRSADVPDAMASPNPNDIIVAPQYAQYRYDALVATRTAVQAPFTYWRGAGVGGSSAINGQIAIRGVPEDYDTWAVLGCDGWSFNDVLPYFNRLETDLRYGDAPFHGKDGPIPIYRAPMARWGAVDIALAEAGLSAGYPFHPDHNEPGALGVSPYAINSREGRRVSVNDGYLEPRRGLNNLRIEGMTLVDKVLIENGRAIGLDVIQSGERRTIRGQHIILSAGAVHSPTILIRSGIGPAAHLAELGVAVIADLPVGEGFQDHPVIAALLPLEDDCTAPAGFRHTNSCIRYSSGLEGAHAGDMMMIALNRRGDSIAHKVAEAYGADSVGMMGVWVNECESRGRVYLRSLDPHEQPVVEENMLSAESDRRRLYDGFFRLCELIASGPVRAITKGVVLGPDNIRFRDLEDYDKFVGFALQQAGDTQHGSCSCRMGRPEDPTTVVDTACRVLGVESLYVIDASVMPTVPCANTNLTCIMIGERMGEVFVDDRV